MSNKAAKAPDLNHWLTKQQAAQLLGTAEKTIDRLADRGELQKAMRKRSGLPPQAVFHPGDLERIKAERDKPLAPFPVPDGQVSDLSKNGEPGHVRHASDMSSPPAVRQQSDMSNLAALLRALRGDSRRPSVPPEAKLFLSFREAVAYSGLPAKHLRELIAAGKLQQSIVGRHGKGEVRRIRRMDLERL